MGLLKNKNQEYLEISTTKALKFKSDIKHNLNGVVAILDYMRVHKPIDPIVSEKINIGLSLVEKISKNYLIIEADPKIVKSPEKVLSKLNKPDFQASIKNDLILLKRISDISTQVRSNVDIWWEDEQKNAHKIGLG